MRSRKRFDAARGGVGRPFRATGGAATIDAAQGSGKPLATFAGVAYTGAEMRPEGWGGRIVCALAGIKVPSQHRPALRQHDHEQIVGHTTAVRITAAGVEVEGVFSGEELHAKKVTAPATNGFQWQLSIGATPTRTHFVESGATEEVNGREVTGPITVADETELGEISFVPLGADGDTSATVSASTRKGNGVMRKFKARLKAMKARGNVRAAKFADEDIEKMTEDEAKAALKKCMAADDDTDTDDDDDADLDADDDDVDADDEPATKGRAKANRRRGTTSAAKRTVRAQRAAAAKELDRQDGIRAAIAKHGGVTHVEIDGKKVNLEAHAIRCGWSAEKTELAALRAARPGAGVGNGPHLHFTSRPEANDAVLECAVFDAAGDKFQLFDAEFYSKETPDRGRISPREQRRIQAELNTRYTDQVRQSAHTLFKGRIGLQQMLTTLAAANGYRGSEVIRDDGDVATVAHYSMIRADGASTSSIANVLANVMNKMMLQGYMWVDGAWKEVTGIGSVKDFKPTKSINLFGDFEFKDLGASGELQHGTLQDQAFANQASTSGRMLTIPRTHIINDDLGALTTVPMLMGRGAGLKLNKAFWTKFMNPGNDDGGSTAFYAAVHTIANQQGASNLSSGGGSALTSAGLTAATLLFDNQVDPVGNPLGIDAEILLYPPDLQTAALELMNSQYIVQSAGATTKQPSDNIWKGRYKPVKARYLNKAAYTGYSATGWYLLANPSVCPVIEIVFLNGQQTPTVQTAGPEFQFNTLGISMRAFFDIGVEKQNFRGGVKSAGA